MNTGIIPGGYNGGNMKEKTFTIAEIAKWLKSKMFSDHFINGLTDKKHGIVQFSLREKGKIEKDNIIDDYEATMAKISMENEKLKKKNAELQKEYEELLTERNLLVALRERER